jgi:hypothetical protein
MGVEVLQTAKVEGPLVGQGQEPGSLPDSEQPGFPECFRDTAQALDDEG